MKKRAPPLALIAPQNIWTRTEFDGWINEMVGEEVNARRELGMDPPADGDFHRIMASIVYNLNYGIVPAGNA